MKIYSIKEIVKATNSFLNSETKTLPKKSKKIKDIKLPPETENIIAEAESTILDENITNNPHRINIDTGCYFSGKLSSVCLSNHDDSRLFINNLSK